MRDCDFPDATVLQTLGDTASAPAFRSDVFDTSRRKPTPQGTQPTLATTSSPSTALNRAAAEAAEQGRMGWFAPVSEDDDFEMHDLLLGEGGQLPSDEDGYQDTDDDSDGDAGHRGGGRGVGGIRRGRAAPVTTHRLLSSMPEEPDEGWQGPNRLPRELVRLGAAAAAPQGRQAASSSGAAAAAAASSQPWFGDAGASSSAAAGAAAATGSAGAGPSSSRPQGAAVAGATSSQAAAAGAAGQDAAADSMRARSGSMSDSLGFDWLWAGVSNSRGLLPDRCFIWGSSGDRLQQVPSTNSQQAAPASASAAAAAAAGGSPAAAAAEGPEPARVRLNEDDDDSTDFTRRKAQRLEGNGARLPRVPAAAATAAAASSRSPQQPPQQQQPATSQQQHRPSRRRQRLAAMAGSLGRHQARWRAAQEPGGSQSSLSAAAAAAAGGDDGDGWFDVSSANMSPARAGRFGPTSSQPALQQAGPTRRAAAGGGGGGDDDGSSSDSDAGADLGTAAAAGGEAMPRRRGGVRPGKGGVPRLRVLHVEGCERLQELQLSHLALEQVVVAGCNSLVVVALHAPKLAVLELQELGDLKGACLQEVSWAGQLGWACKDCVCFSLSGQVHSGLRRRLTSLIAWLHVQAVVRPLSVFFGCPLCTAKRRTVLHSQPSASHRR